MPSKPASRSAGRSNIARPAADDRRDGHTPAAASRASGRKPNADIVARLVDRLPDIVFRYRLRPKPGYEYISPAVEELTGYRPADFYADPEFDEKIVHPDDRPALLNAITRRTTGPVRLRWMHRDDGAVWIEVNAVPIRNRKGEVVGLEGVARNVSDRVEVEERAQEVQAFMSALMAATGDVIAVTDKEWRLIVCNDAFAVNYQRKPRQLQGQLVTDIWTPEIAKRRLRYMRKAVRTGKTVRVDDETVAGRHFDVVIEPIKGGRGKVLGVAIMARDVSKRRRAEDRLKASEERYRLLYQDNPTMYFTVSAKGKTLSVNRFGAQQLGYEPADLTGKPVLDIFHPEDQKLVAEQMKACVERPDDVHGWEFRKLRKDGTTMWVKEAARATEGPDGSTIVLIVCEDISERKRMEAELQQAREEIESRVERTLEKKNPYDLTFRQLTVLHLVVQGKSDREIGLALGISPLTVNTHMSRALRKMGASSRTEAGVRALREGLIQ